MYPTSHKINFLQDTFELSHFASVVVVLFNLSSQRNDNVLSRGSVCGRVSQQKSGEERRRRGRMLTGPLKLRWGNTYNFDGEIHTILMEEYTILMEKCITTI